MDGKNPPQLTMEQQRAIKFLTYFADIAGMKRCQKCNRVYLSHLNHARELCFLKIENEAEKEAEKEKREEQKKNTLIKLERYWDQLDEGHKALCLPPLPVKNVESFLREYGFCLKYAPHLPQNDSFTIQHINFSKAAGSILGTLNPENFQRLSFEKLLAFLQETSEGTCFGDEQFFYGKDVIAHISIGIEQALLSAFTEEEKKDKKRQEKKEKKLKKGAQDEENSPGDGASMSEPLAQPHSGEEDQDQSAKNVSGSATATTTSQLQTPNAKSKKQEASGPSSPSPGVLNSVASSNEAGGSLSTSSGEAAVPQTMAVQNMMHKLMGMHEKLLKPMTMSKAIEDNNDALLAQLLELSGKVTNLIDDLNKDLEVMLEKNVKDGLADVKEVPVSAITQAIEQSQTVPLAVSYRQESFSSAVSGSRTVEDQLSRLVNERKYEEALTDALERDEKADTGLVLWLLTQVDHHILQQEPMPLGVALIISLHSHLLQKTPDSFVLDWMVHLESALRRYDCMGSFTRSYLNHCKLRTT